MFGFDVTLGVHSRYAFLWLSAVGSPDRPRRPEAAWRRRGGSSAACRAGWSSNLKAVVTRADRYAPTIARVFPEYGQYCAPSAIPLSPPPRHRETESGALDPLTVGQFITVLLRGTFPWARLRQAQKLLRLAERNGPDRINAACAPSARFRAAGRLRVEVIVRTALEKFGSRWSPRNHRLKL